MITASHNPPEYNGFKVFNKSGEALDDETRLSLKNPKKLTYDGRASSLEPADPREYKELLSRVVFKKKWKVVLDCGNGAASQLAPAIYRDRLDKVTTINSYPDGGFPGRGSEPTRKSVQTLGSMVGEIHFDAGIAFDGDADRMYIVDEKGVCPLQDRILASYIAFLSKRSKGPFVVPLDASMVLDEVAEKTGARLVRGKDTGGHFDLIPAPEGELHPAALARHERVYGRYRDNYEEQVTAHERQFAAAD